jgi:hypothetical protein
MRARTSATIAASVIRVLPASVRERMIGNR